MAGLPGMNNCHEAFFRYTSGRWIDNEAEQLSRRYRKFNVEALKQVAAQAAGACNVADMVKVAEGANNKIFLLTLDDGREVIARIPTPIAGPAHYVTASEVATMDYARNRLGIPVPKVLAWASDSSATPVNAEFIVMEKAPGIELWKVWPDLTPQLKDTLVDEWARVEHSMLRQLSGGYGSIFYREDLQTADKMNDLFTDGTKEDKFVIGPVMTPSRTFWEGHRENLLVSRGPCTWLCYRYRTI